MGAVFLNRVGALQQAPLFRHFNEIELSEVTHHGTIERLHRNDLLVVEGEASRGLLVLVDGLVRIFREGPDGREQVIRTACAVNMLNEAQLFDDRPHAASVSACEESLILRLPLAECRQRVQGNARALQDALQLLSIQLHQALDLVDALSLLSVDQRVAQFLLEQARRHRNRFRADLCVDLTMSNQQIGAVVGAVREVVSRSLRKLQTLGLVAGEGRTFKILSEPRMEEFIQGRPIASAGQRAASG